MSTQLVDLSRKVSERSLTLVLSLSMSVYSFWLSSNRTWRFNFGFMPGHFSDTFFQRQAVSILQGRLDVSGGTYFKDGECWYRAGKCFGYFGIFPSLVRMPLFLVTRQTSLGFTPVSIAIASGIGLWASLDILQRALNSPKARGISGLDRRLMILVAAGLLGTGGSLVTVSQAKVFREATIWMIALLLLTFSLTLRWISTNKSKWLVLALVAAIGATNSRPSAIPAVVLLGIWLYLIRFKNQSTIVVNFLSLEAAMVFLPAATALFVFYLKFRELTPPWPSYATYNDAAIQRYLRLNDGVLQGFRYAPTNLAQYFRPDSVRYSFGNPWAHVLVPTERPPILVPPVVNGGMYFEPMSSITNTMPVQMLLTLALVGFSLTRSKLLRFVDSSVAVPLLGIAALVPALVLTAFGNTGRYVGDFFPLLVVGTIFGGVAVCSWLEERRLLRTSLCIAMAVATYFSVIQFALNIEGWNFSG